MKTYLFYILTLIALMACLVFSIQAHLLWPSITLGIALIWLCTSLYGRIERLLYAYHETEKENEQLHTRLAEAERQLLYLRQLAENVDTALFVCDTEGRIDWMNHAAEQTLPQPLPAKEGSLPSNILQAIDEGAEVVDGCALSTVLLRIDGKRRLVIALKDVSALMQRQEMEAWQQLIRVLTHEIMNSLTPIISISETLTNENEAFAVINRRCHSLQDFVESYRQLTRIKIPEKSTFPISELFEHIKGLYPQVVTVLDGSSVEHQLKADRSQIEQVLINLIKNAYESGATEVEVTARGEGVICVQDNGCGMSPDVLEHAFIPFFTTKPTGTGIGLALCRQIILKHGGTISVESVPDKGTTITLSIEH
ncbi:MAG: ATP-binding protein [Bacteroidaceae bacterium]|nr:ATP-binding protein [Bacteroidaceae bacterium]